ncbi:MAG TPA: hypothetical protein VEW42_03715 [Candidatus Eisenbacteria bacterium]|nr:hypothetical protein [Candidatus Eisenbacteria bacterium]
MIIEDEKEDQSTQPASSPSSKKQPKNQGQAEQPWQERVNGQPQVPWNGDSLGRARGFHPARGNPLRR